MKDDAFDRAVRRSERLETADRWRAALKLFLSLAGGGVVGVGIVALLLDEPALSPSFMPMMVPYAGTAVVMAVLVGLGVIDAPLWNVPQVDGLRVQWAVITGRGVRRPELAGLAVSTAQMIHRSRWLVALPGASAVLFLVLDVPWPIKAGFVLLFAAMLAMAVNARKAEAANRALLAAPS